MPINYKIFKANLKVKEACYYPVLIPYTKISQDNLNKYISDRCTLTDSDIEAVIAAIKTQTALTFASGNSICFGDMGTFKPRIKMEFNSKGKAVKGTEKVFKVDFIPSASLLREFAAFKFKCIGFYDYTNFDFEKRLDMFLETFETGEYFNACTYASRLNVSKTTAYLEIKKLIAKGYVQHLVTLGRGVFIKI